MRVFKVSLVFTGVGLRFASFGCFGCFLGISGIPEGQINSFVVHADHLDFFLEELEKTWLLSGPGRQRRILLFEVKV